MQLLKSIYLSFLSLFFLSTKTDDGIDPLSSFHCHVCHIVQHDLKSRRREGENIDKIAFNKYKKSKTDWRGRRAWRGPSRHTCKSLHALKRTTVETGYFLFSLLVLSAHKTRVTWKNSYNERDKGERQEAARNRFQEGDITSCFVRQMFTLYSLLFTISLRQGYKEWMESWMESWMEREETEWVLPSELPP